MNRKKSIFLGTLVAILMVLLVLFAAKTEPMHNTDENDSEVFLEYSHGVSSPDPEYGVIACSNNVASFEYVFQNGELPSNFGLLLFLDGMLQPYSTDERSDVRLMHIVELQPGEEKSIEILFKPVVTQNARSSLYIAAIYDADNNMVNAGSNGPFVHHLSQSIPLWVEVGAGQRQQKIPAIDISNCAIDAVTLSYSSYERLPQNDTIFLDSQISPDGTTNLHLQVYCPYDDGANYRIYLFENHRLIMWENQQYCDTNISAGSYADVSLALKPAAADSFYYAIAVPTKVADRWSAPLVVKSKSIVIN